VPLIAGALPDDVEDVNAPAPRKRVRS
jgi:hypothetical protein